MTQDELNKLIAAKKARRQQRVALAVANRIEYNRSRGLAFVRHNARKLPRGRCVGTVFGQGRNACHVH